MAAESSARESLSTSSAACSERAWDGDVGPSRPRSPRADAAARPARRTAGRTPEGLPAAVHQTAANMTAGRDYADVSPIRGVIHGGGEQRTRVAVDVVRRV